MIQAKEAIEILREVLDGSRPADSEARHSAAVLSERLDHIKRIHPVFQDVCFSPHMEQLTGKSTPVAVG